MKWEIMLKEWESYKAKSRHRQRQRRLNRAKGKAEQKYPTYTPPVPKVNTEQNVEQPVEKSKKYIWAWILVWGAFVCLYLWWTLPEMVFAVMVRRIWKKQDVYQAIAEVLIRRFYRAVEWIEDMTDIALIEGFGDDIDILSPAFRGI